MSNWAVAKKLVLTRIENLLIKGIGYVFLNTLKIHT